MTDIVAKYRPDTGQLYLDDGATTPPGSATGSTSWPAAATPPPSTTTVSAITSTYLVHTTANAPGNGQEYGHQAAPNQVGDKPLGAWGHVTYSGLHYPITTRLLDSETYGTESVTVADYSWNDGGDGSSVGTAHLWAAYGRFSTITVFE